MLCQNFCFGDLLRSPRKTEQRFMGKENRRTVVGCVVVKVA